MKCPICEKRTKGFAIDDYFGRHHYGLQCTKCENVWDMDDAKCIYEVKKEDIKEQDESAPNI